MLLCFFHKTGNNTMEPKIVPIKVQEKAKIVLAFLLKLLYTKQVASAKETWSIGQAVKTSPSHGENRGSIPLSTAGKLLEIQKLFYVTGNSYGIPCYIKNLRGMRTRHSGRWLLKQPCLGARMCQWHILFLLSKYRVDGLAYEDRHDQQAVGSVHCIHDVPVFVVF